MKFPIKTSNLEGLLFAFHFHFASLLRFMVANLSLTQFVIDEMSAEGELCYEETLFSRAEHSYLNYMLNKAQWSNGLDLRNRYIHGTFSKYNEAIQQENYWQFLMLTVMVILKINDEFCLKFEREISI